MQGQNGGIKTFPGRSSYMSCVIMCDSAPAVTGNAEGNRQGKVCNQGIETEEAIYSWTLLDQFKH